MDTKNIKKLTAASAGEFFADPTLPKVVLFTDKPKSSHLYMALSMEYKGRLAFAEISNKETALGAYLPFFISCYPRSRSYCVCITLAEKYGVEQFPTLLVIKNDEEQTVTKYESELSFRDIDKFLSTFAPKPAKKTKASASNDAEEKVRRHRTIV